ncbi:GNAT family N-acetyltransferase [Microbispora sp. RL4-1S]|uniref:GNAT family N-acetyltransferase n=1 Tax=Microbispora oryzae TaxID=2806554 RepID=A0A940WDN4_9ACTN|nr:GNAT family N-acetyltransferase [Microbispora oryzae]
MEFEQIDPAAGGDGLTRLHAISTAYEKPGPTTSLRLFTARIEDGYGGGSDELAEAWVARVDGEVVGGHFVQCPVMDNTHLASALLAVRPDLLRRGFGGALLDHAIGRARAHGRELLITEASADGPGTAFAKARGFTPASTESRYVLDLDAADLSRLELMRAEAAAHARDYTLERWTGPADAELLDDMALLMAGMNDEPVGDLDLRERRWTAERVRAMEERGARSGLQRYTTVARHTATGEPAGLTQLVVDAGSGDGWALQGATCVLRPHRGRRLGLVLKLANLAWFHGCAPSVNRVITWNAAGNPHMIAINEAIGFRTFDTWHQWQLAI